MLQTCLTVLEHASSASPSTEEHLIGIKLQAQPQASSSAPGAGQTTTTAPAMLVQCINSLAGSTVAPGHAEAASRSARSAAFLLDSQGTSSSTGELDLVVPGTNGQHSQTVTDCLHAALSALMNLTHNNETGCCMTAEAGGLEAAAGLLAALAHSQPSPLTQPSTQDFQGLPMTGTQLVDSQDSRGLPMTCTQLMDSQTSTSGTAFSSDPEHLAHESMPEAEANGCQPPCNALPADPQPCASLQNLLRVCRTLQIPTVPSPSSSCTSSPRQKPQNLKPACSCFRNSDALSALSSVAPSLCAVHGASLILWKSFEALAATCNSLLVAAGFAQQSGAVEQD